MAMYQYKGEATKLAQFIISKTMFDEIVHCDSIGQHFADAVDQLRFPLVNNVSFSSLLPMQLKVKNNDW